MNQLWEMKLDRPVRLTEPRAGDFSLVTDASTWRTPRIGMGRCGRYPEHEHRRYAAADRAVDWSPGEPRLVAGRREDRFESALDSGAGSQALYVADVASGQFRQVFGPNQKGAAYEIAFEPGTPSGGPDSNTIALAVQQSYSTRFREGASEILTVSATTGETHQYDPYPYETLTNRVKGEGPVWSPDGKYIAYVLDDVVWVLPVTPDGAPAGPPRQLTSEVADQLSWSGDSQHILYDSAGRCGWSR